MISFEDMNSPGMADDSGLGSTVSRLGISMFGTLGTVGWALLSALEMATVFGSGTCCCAAGSCASRLEDATADEAETSIVAGRGSSGPC